VFRFFAKDYCSAFALVFDIAGFSDRRGECFDDEISHAAAFSEIVCLYFSHDVFSSFTGMRPGRCPLQAVDPKGELVRLSSLHPRLPLGARTAAPFLIKCGILAKDRNAEPACEGPRVIMNVAPSVEHAAEGAGAMGALEVQRPNINVPDHVHPADAQVRSR
jgi:hypothetical protein